MPHRREPQAGSARTHAGVRWKGWGRAPGPAGAALTLPITMITDHHSSAQRSRMVRASLLRINQISRERGEGSERNSACTARRHTGGVSVLPIGNNLVIAILPTQRAAQERQTERATRKNQQRYMRTRSRYISRRFSHLGSRDLPSQSRPIGSCGSGRAGTV